MNKADCKASCEAYEVILSRLAEFNDHLSIVSNVSISWPVHIRDQLNEILRLLPEMAMYLESKDYLMCEDFLTSSKDFSERFAGIGTHDNQVITTRYGVLLQKYFALRTQLRESLSRYRKRLYR